ncbi:MAG: TonB-dependent receptor [Gammaproteobacteria bacterium]|nr:hypothetical protein [Chromatiales bacterium]MDP6675203.1 TonB-dependent receptor [Gammaproteobacteria bacterium]
MGWSWMKRVLPGALIFFLAISWSLAAWSQVEEIVVTVRKKGENLQDVPMSVSAMGAAEIERKGIKDIADIAQFSTSLQFDESFAQSDTRIAVRGLSPTRGRQNVALLVDGVDVSSEAITSSGGSLLLNTRLVDIQRIEVVLGPQMALYGRSAFNGAIQYITKDAADEFEADFKLDASKADNSGGARQYEAIAGVSGPIFGDALGLRLNGALWDDEGFHRNQITGKRIGGGEGYGLALTLNSDIGDNLSFKFRAEYTDDESQPSAQAFLKFNTELDVPQGAFDAGVAECFPDFVDFVATNPANIPDYANNQAYRDRGLRLLDPAYVATLDPATLNPNLPEFVIPAGGGPYCEERTPVRVGRVPDGDSLAVTLAPDPTTPGVDYQGFDREMFRLSFVASYEAESWSLKSMTGLTHDDNIEQQDTNAFAIASPDAGKFLDGNPNTFGFNNSKATKQFSQDIYARTSLDGPLNGTLGALYWREWVDNRSKSITAQGSGSHCFWNSVSGVLFDIENACPGYTEIPVAPYQQAGAQFRKLKPSPADRDTEHWSIYGTLDFEFAENWTLAFDGRYNHEKVDVEGPIFFDPGASGGPGGLNPCGIFFRPCQTFDDWQADGNWFADKFFPWTDEAVDGTDLGAFVPDEALLASIPDLCRQQDPDAVQRSIAEGPFQIERDAEGIPVWNNGVVPVLDADGKAVLTPGGPDMFNPWCVDQEGNTDSWFSPKVRLEWAAGDDMLFYVSWSRARKPGGFSLLTIGSSGLNRELAEFDAEKMVVWEVGANTNWFENTIVLNGSVFFQDFTDKQALTSALGNDGRLISKIENAGSAEVWGSEISIDWSPITEFLGGNWRTSLGWTWLPVREYTDFVISSTSPTTSAHARNCTPDGELCSISYTGKKLENSAENSVNGFVQYMIPLTASVSTYIETDVFWQSKRFVGITNNLWTDSILEFNLRIGLEGERWDALLYVDNLLDDDTVRSVGGGPGLGCCFILASGLDVAGDPPRPRSAVMVDLPLFNTAFLPDPRIIGARISYSFGGG